MELKNRNPLIICTCGKAGSGKSLVGEIICNEYKKNNLKVIISPYTKYLKKYISEITDWDMSDKDKPRNLLQKLSSELIKKELNNKDFFIKRQLEDIDVYSYFFDVIIIPDVRFPEEIEVLKEKYDNVVAISVIRDSFDNGLSVEQKKDITEVALDNYQKFDYILKNDGTDFLEKEAAKILKNIEMRDSNE